MERENFLNAIRGKVIADLISHDQHPIIITEDGFQIDVANLQISNPAFEKEESEFQEKLAKATPDTFFEIKADLLDIDQMRRQLNDHIKKVNANGGGITRISNDRYKVSLGESLNNFRELRN